jgi:hypothetical protein
MMIKPTDFTKIKHDINGNPRYVCHFTLLDAHGWQSPLSVSERYDLAVKLAKKLGGKRYHTKTYGGGIVFQTYNIDQLCNQINALMEATQ